jgi:hypothetical protein
MKDIALSSAIMAGFDDGRQAMIMSALKSVNCRCWISIIDMGKRSASFEFLHNIDFDIFIVNLDAFALLGEGVDEMLKFRKRNRKAAVVLVSSALRDDDLRDTRRFIGDAMLRPPLEHARLQWAVEAALENHGRNSQKSA